MSLQTQADISQNSRQKQFPVFYTGILTYVVCIQYGDVQYNDKALIRGKKNCFQVRAKTQDVLERHIFG